MNKWISSLPGWLAGVWLIGCASVAPPPPVAVQLLHDEFFAPSTERIGADEVFALSAPMKQYISTNIAAQLQKKGIHQGLIEALYSRTQLRLEYDSAITRNAAQAFEARQGNCLSLVIMTAAFAKELGIDVQYQRITIDPALSRSGDLVLLVGHVNLVLGKGARLYARSNEERSLMTVDFLPQDDIRGQRVEAIDEERIVSMYMNNRAVEAMTSGRLEQAYWWSRAAIEHAPGDSAAYNTLGIIYSRHGNLAEAAQVFSHILEREPDNVTAMANLMPVLKEQGQVAQADLLAQRMVKIEENAPFHFFDLGKTAMQQGDYKAAKAWFAKEVDRADYYHEFHYWLALAELRLGEITQAQEQLRIALEGSGNLREHDLYAAKLERIKAYTASHVFQ